MAALWRRQEAGGRPRGLHRRHSLLLCLYWCISQVLLYLDFFLFFTFVILELSRSNFLFLSAATSFDLPRYFPCSFVQSLATVFFVQCAKKVGAEPRQQQQQQQQQTIKLLLSNVKCHDMVRSYRKKKPPKPAAKQKRTKLTLIMAPAISWPNRKTRHWLSTDANVAAR